MDLHRIATSGQMFRWQKSETGWLVQDGDHWYRITESEPLVFSVTSNVGIESLQKMFRLEQDHGLKLRRIVALGSELEPYFESMKGLRIMRPSSRVETLFSFLCTSNNHVSRITGMVNKLAAFGDEEERDTVTFPGIERLAKVTEEELRALGFGYRGRTIPQVAQELLRRGGDRYLESLSKAAFDEARKELIELPGIGPKLADCICLFGLDHTEAVPIDTHIWQQLTKLYFPDWAGTALTHTKYDHASRFFRDRFGPDAGAAHQFLFVQNMTDFRNNRSKGSKI